MSKGTSASVSAAMPPVRRGKSLGRRILDHWQLYLLLGTKIDFLTEASAIRTIYIVSGIWQEAGWGTIVYLATLSTVDPALYEAAKIDGASMFQRILHIDFPALVPMIVLMLIMSAGSLMNVGFDSVIMSVEKFDMMTE